MIILPATPSKATEYGSGQATKSPDQETPPPADQKAPRDTVNLSANAVKLSDELTPKLSELDKNPPVKEVSDKNFNKVVEEAKNAQNQQPVNKLTNAVESTRIDILA